MKGEIANIVADELARAQPAPVTAFAARIAEEGGAPVQAVLFYGSTLRTGDMSGLLDFYVIVDGLKAWRPEACAWPHLVLPPRVEYWERDIEGRGLRAKLAILTLEQFERLMQPRCLNTTVWARFCQPAALVYMRDLHAQTRIVAALTQAVESAACWAARLGPPQARAGVFWSLLFNRTYAAEIRVEAAGRASGIVAFHAARYERLLPLAWQSCGIAYAMEGEALRPSLSPHRRVEARRAWRTRALLAKPLNLMRLVKAAFSFEGAADYAAWKLERHTGMKLELTPWQRRHPLLAAPPVVWRLWRQGVLR